MVAVLFSVPFAMASVSQAPRMRWLEWAGLGLALCATAGESIADRQAQAFKRIHVGDRSSVLNVGLWRYSRHPNYFFESLVWWGFFVAALDFPYGWTTAVCPFLMLYFLLRVTGIPLTEKHSLESRGEAYREYSEPPAGSCPGSRKNRRRARRARGRRRSATRCDWLQPASGAMASRMSARMKLPDHGFQASLWLRMTASSVHPKGRSSAFCSNPRLRADRPILAHAQLPPTAGGLDAGADLHPAQASCANSAGGACPASAIWSGLCSVLSARNPRATQDSADRSIPCDT